MPDFGLSDWVEPDEYARMRRYFELVVEPIIQIVQECNNDRDAAFAAKYLLDKVVWGLTTCVDKHKLNLRYLSEGAREVFEELNRGSRTRAARREELLKSLRHEHVVPRKVVIARLLQGDGSVLSEAVACVVTIDEHKRLGSGTGWPRYKDARIRVWDRSTGNWMSFEQDLSTPPVRLKSENHPQERGNSPPSVAPEVCLPAGRYPVMEADIVAALAAVGLRANKDSEAYRGADGTIANRYVWWPKTKSGVVRTLHLGRYRAETPLTRPIKNGNVRFEVVFLGSPRDVAIASLEEAVRLLVQRA